MSEAIEIASTYVSVGISTEGLGAAIASDRGGIGKAFANLGKKAGVQFAGQFEEKSAGATRAAERDQESLSKSVDAAVAKVKAARAVEAAATRKVGIEEEKLRELRDAGAKTSQILAAEDRLANARVKEALATQRTTGEVDRLKDAQRELRASMDEAADEAEQSTARIGAAFSRLPNPFGRLPAEARSSLAKVGEAFAEGVRDGLRDVERQAGNAGGDAGDAFGDRFRGAVGRIAPGIGSMFAKSIGVAAAAGGIGAAGGLVAPLVTGLTALAPAALALPGIMAAAGAGMAVFGMVAADAGERLGGLGEKFSALQDNVSDGFWDRATAPIENLVTSLLPSLSENLGFVGRAMGSATASIADGINGLNLENKFAGLVNPLIKSIHIAKAAAVPLVQAFVNIGTIGAQYLPTITRFITDIAVGLAGMVNQAAATGQLQQMAASAAGLFGQLAGVIKNIAGDVVGVVGGIIKAIAGVGDPATLSFLPTLFDQLNAFINSPAGQGMLTTLFSSLQSALQQITPMLPMLGGLIAQLVPVFAELVSQGAAVLVDLLVALVPVVGQLIAAVAPLVPLLGEMLSTAIQSVAPILQQLAAVVFPVLAQVITALVPVITMLVQQMGPILQPIIAALPPILTVLGGALVQVAGFVMQVIAAVAPLAAQLMAMLMPALMQIVAAVAQVIPPLLQLASTILTMLMPVIQSLMPVVQIVFNTIVSVVQAAMNIVQGVIKLVMGIITGDWSLAWAGIKQLFSGIWDAIKAILSGALEVMKGVISAAWDVIKNIFSTAGAFLSGLWSGMWDGLKAAGSSALDWIKGMIDGGLNAVKSFFQNAVDGIGRIWDGLKRAAADPVRFVIDTVINSGIIKGWNDLAGLLKLDNLKIKPVSVPGFWRGGVLPGPGVSSGDDMLVIDRAGRPQATVASGEPVISRAQYAANRPVVDAILAGRKLPGFFLGGTLPTPGPVRPHRLPYYGATWAGDMGLGMGSPIYAWKDGVVATVSHKNVSYGNETNINHAGQSTKYAHQSVILVRPGDVVKAGQLIGRIGSTGNSTGPHLHFEVRGGNVNAADATGSSGGGMFDAAAAMMGWVTDKLASPVRSLIDKIPGAGMFVDVAKGMGSNLLNAAVEKIKTFLPTASDPGLSGPAAPVSGSQWQVAEALMKAGKALGANRQAMKIALMTVMQECSMQPDYTTDENGDAGLFQNRPGRGDGTIAQLNDPYYSLRLFLFGKTMPGGWKLPSLYDQPNWANKPEWQAAAWVQRPYKPYEPYYQKHSEWADSALAKFGYWRGTDSAASGWALVGERGRELVHMGGGETVLNNRNTEALLRGDLTGETKIVIEGNVGWDPDELAHELEKRRRRAMKRAGMGV